MDDGQRLNRKFSFDRSTRRVKRAAQDAARFCFCWAPVEEVSGAGGGALQFGAAVVASPGKCSPMQQDSLSLRHRSNRTGALSSTKYCDR